MNKTSISVIFPTFNRLDFVKEAVALVSKQSLLPVELFLVGDSSTDGTEEYGQGVGTHNDPVSAGSLVVRYLRLPHSGLPGKVRNAGVRAAKGEYLAFLDSDDLWKTEKLSRQVAFFQAHPDIRICYTREVWLRNGKVVSQAGQRHAHSGYIFPDALKKCIIGPSTVMLKRSLFEEVGDFREDLEIEEDYELWLRVTARYSVGYIDEPLLIKRAGHPAQLSEKYGQIEIFRIKVLQLNLDAGTFAGEHRMLACRELARKGRIYNQGCKKRGRLEEALQYRQLAAQYEDES